MSSCPCGFQSSHGIFRDRADISGRQSQPAGKKKTLCLSADQNHEHWTNCNNNNNNNNNNNLWMRLSLFLCTSSGTMLSVCLPGCRSVCRDWGPMLKPDTKY